MPERVKHTKALHEDDQASLRTDRDRRLFTDGRGRISGLKLGGEALPDHLGAKVVTGSLSLSTTQKAELALTFTDQGYDLLGDNRFELGMEVDFHDLSFKVASVSAGGDGLGVIARDATWATLRHQSGADVERNVSPSQYVAHRCRKLGVVAVVQESPKRRTVGRKGRETDAKAFVRLAGELGYYCFASGGVLYFGQPTWLAPRGTVLEVSPGDKFLRNEHPLVSASVDDPAHTSAVELALEPEVGDRVRPGMAVLLDKVRGFDLPYLVNDVTIPLNVADPVIVSAGTPVDPQPVTTGGAGGRSSGGGSSRIGDLLDYVGFTGNGRRIAVGVSGAESGYDATILGDLTLMDAKWGPSVGLFQIRSLKRPQDWSGNDAMRVRDKLLDPVYNARLARKLSGDGRYWGAWSTFTSGAYQNSLGQENAIIKHWNGLPTPGGGGTGTVTIGSHWPTEDRGIGTPYHQAGSWSAGYHTGVDLHASDGSPIRSVCDGRVNYSGNYGEYGNMVRVRAGRYDLMYCHLTSQVARVGDTVKAGQLIGHAGHTGRVFSSTGGTGAHLHFEVRPAGAGYGNEVNPCPFLPGNGGSGCSIVPVPHGVVITP